MREFAKLASAMRASMSASATSLDELDATTRERYETITRQAGETRQMLHQHQALLRHMQEQRAEERRLRCVIGLEFGFCTENCPSLEESFIFTRFGSSIK